MNNAYPESLPQSLMRYLSLSENGFGVLDANNIFVFHNDALAGMLGFSGISMLGRSFDDMMTVMYENQCGPVIKAPTLQDWLDYAHSRQRSAPFRSFEVDLVDGRWLLLSEQVLAGGEVIMLVADITGQKRVEAKLKQAQADLERLALTDDLTGVPNRRHLMQRLEQELSRARRHHQPMCLAMLDLDRFKQVNDNFGHYAGDLVLSHFAAFLRTHVRAGDIVGRLGGEEFAVLLPQTKMEDALFVLRRVSAQLALQNIDAVAPGFSYTFSGGVAALPKSADNASCQWLLVGADKALYDAKRSGRDRILPYNA